jgi:hypothetical protein
MREFAIEGVDVEFLKMLHLTSKAMEWVGSGGKEGYVGTPPLIWPSEFRRPVYYPAPAAVQPTGKK